MPRSRIFKFCQFSVQDARCAMKVGTDGVLLGLYSSYMNRRAVEQLLMSRCTQREAERTGSSCVAPPTIHVLDIGVGSGVVSLIVLQHLMELSSELSIRLEVNIVGVDVDSEACQDAEENYAGALASNPQWKASTVSSVVCADIADLPAQYNHHFDIVVCNPPFFNDAGELPEAKKGETKTMTLGRKRARFQSSLTPGKLGSVVSKVLHPADGVCFLIYPVTVAQSKAEKQQDVFLKSIENLPLKVNNILEVADAPLTVPIRRLYTATHAESESAQGEPAIRQLHLHNSFAVHTSASSPTSRRRPYSKEYQEYAVRVYPFLNRDPE